MKKNKEISDMIADLENFESANEKVTSILNENLTWLKTDGVEADNIAVIDGMLYDINVDITFSKWKLRVEFTRISPNDGVKFYIVIYYKDSNDSLFSVYRDAPGLTFVPEGLVKIFNTVRSEIASNPDEKEDEYI